MLMHCTAHGDLADQAVGCRSAAHEVECLCCQHFVCIMINSSWTRSRVAWDVIDFRFGASLRQALIRSRFSSNDECGRHACGEDARRRGHHAAHRQQEICSVRSRVACHVYDFRSGIRPRQAPPSPCMGDFVPPCGGFSQQLY